MIFLAKSSVASSRSSSLTYNYVTRSISKLKDILNETRACTGFTFGSILVFLPSIDDLNKARHLMNSHLVKYQLAHQDVHLMVPQQHHV